MIDFRGICGFIAALALSALLAGACFACGGEEFWLDISKGEHILRVMQGGEVVESFGIATGKNAGNKERVGDMRTPEGTFSVVQVQDSSWWTHDFGDGKGEISGAYGPWFVRLKTGWQGIGIHGTHDPASIGTDATEGCIRLTNENIAKLKEKYVTIGMRVVIRP